MSEIDDEAPAGGTVAAALIELLDLDSGARASRLSRLRAESPELAAELERLLAADRATDGPLERARALVASSAGRQLAGEAPRALDRVGAWRLVRRLGVGGMGEVWLGERAEGGFAQQAAIKFVRAGFATEPLVERFRLERQVLARLAHPSIAALLDGGVAADGRPWFAMELVVGEPVTEYAERLALPLEARLELLIAIASAVDFAHRALVVHRDLKPSNILVVADGRPKLLDFGLAKLLEPELDQRMTLTEMRVLTPAYAAPEQVLGEPITTATDVYALGVLLYELLTGELPHRRGEVLPSALAAEVARESFERPSARMRRPVESEEADARARRARRLRGDLDTITLKALAREPERRYPTAAALADDLRRHLEGRPVAARPDTLGYVAGRFARRHRVAVGAAALVALSLAGGVGAALVSGRRAAEQATRAELVKEFLLSLFREQDPVTRAKAEARSAKELVAQGVARAEKELGADPALQAEVLADLGALQFGLGDAASAAELLGRALAEIARRDGTGSARYASAEANRAAALAASGHLDEAGPMARHAVAVLTDNLGPEALATARARQHLSRILLLEGQGEAALSEARAAHAALVARLGEEAPESVAALVGVGTMLEQRDRLDEALAAFRRAVEILERTQGAEHAGLSRPLAMVGDILRRQQKYAEALPYFDRSTELARRHLGDRHPLLGGQLLRKGDLLRRLGRYDDADRAFDEAANCFGPERAEAAQVHSSRAALRRAQRRLPEAADEYAAAHRGFLATLGEQSVYPWGPVQMQAGILIELGRLAEAEPLAVEALARLEAIAGADSYDASLAAAMLGLVRRGQGRFDEAAALHERAVATLEKVYGADHPETAEQRFELAVDWRRIGSREALGRSRVALDRVLASLAAGTSLESRRAEIEAESSLVTSALAALPGTPGA